MKVVVLLVFDMKEYIHAYNKSFYIDNNMFSKTQDNCELVDDK